MPKIITVDNVIDPQHYQIRVADPKDGSPCLLTVYSGMIDVAHFTPNAITALGISYPVLGVVPVPQPGPVLAEALLGLNDKNQLKAATACVSVANFVDRTDPCVVAIMEAKANLYDIKLSNGHHAIAVVLDAGLQGQNSQIHTLSYQVSVLTTLLDPAASDPIVKVGPNWDGKYGRMTFLRMGIPQE